MKTRPKNEIALAITQTQEKIKELNNKSDTDADADAENENDIILAYKICVDVLKKALKHYKPLTEPKSFEEADEQTEVFKQQIKSITKVDSLKGRCIIVMCIDWINGYDSDYLLKLKHNEKG